MKKELAALIFLGLFLPLLVLAQITIPNPLKVETFRDFIDGIITLLFWIALAIFPLMIVIAGLLMVTAAGDPKRVETAKNIILYTVIGFLVILLAKGFIELLEKVLLDPLEKIGLSLTDFL